MRVGSIQIKELVLGIQPNQGVDPRHSHIFVCYCQQRSALCYHGSCHFETDKRRKMFIENITGRYCRKHRPLNYKDNGRKFLEKNKRKKISVYHYTMYGSFNRSKEDTPLKDVNHNFQSQKYLRNHAVISSISWTSEAHGSIKTKNMFRKIETDINFLST